KTRLAKGLPEVPADDVQLQQVLLNIITNACDAMAENPPGDRRLRISTSAESGSVCVSIADQGRGLPNGDSSQIFEPFFTTKSHGLGIGLAICRSIIAAHHGLLWSEPNKGRGVTLRIELPAIWPALSVAIQTAWFIFWMTNLAWSRRSSVFCGPGELRCMYLR